MTSKAKTENKTFGDGDVSLDLAHPLPVRTAIAFGITDVDEEIPARSTVKVGKEYAKRLIQAGLVQVDPEDKAAVKEALRGASPENKEAGLPDTPVGSLAVAPSETPAKSTRSNA